MSEETELFDELNRDPEAPPTPVVGHSEGWSREKSDVYADLREPSTTPTRDALDAKRVRTLPASERVSPYKQIQESMGQNLAALETELNQLAENLSPILAPGDDVPDVEAKAPGKSQAITDMTTYDGRIAHAAAVLHSLNTRGEF